jgi:hypothetical protein
MSAIFFVNRFKGGLSKTAIVRRSTLSRLPPGARTLPDRFTLLALDEQPPRLHGGGTADVVAALEPLAVERHRQSELLGADFVNLDGGGSGFHDVEPMSSAL